MDATTLMSEMACLRVSRCFDVEHHSRGLCFLKCIGARLEHSRCLLVGCSCHVRLLLGSVTVGGSDMCEFVRALEHRRQ